MLVAILLGALCWLPPGEPRKGLRCWYHCKDESVNRSLGAHMRCHHVWQGRPCLGQGEGGCFKAVSKSHCKLEELHFTVSHIQQRKMYWCVCHLGLWVLETLTWLCCGYHRDYQWVYMWGHILEHQMSIRGSLLPKRAQEPNGSWTWPSHVYKLLGWLWWAVSEIIECNHPELSKIGEESWIM